MKEINSANVISDALQTGITVQPSTKSVDSTKSTDTTSERNASGRIYHKKGDHEDEHGTYSIVVEMPTSKIAALAGKLKGEFYSKNSPHPDNPLGHHVIVGRLYHAAGTHLSREGGTNHYTPIIAKEGLEHLVTHEGNIADLVARTGGKFSLLKYPKRLKASDEARLYAGKAMSGPKTKWNATKDAATDAKATVSNWFSRKSKEAQADYIARHPKSQFVNSVQLTSETTDSEKSKWFDRLSDKKRTRYLQRHPKSMYQEHPA